MLVQRLSQQSARRLFAIPPSTSPLARLYAPTSLHASKISLQSRPSATSAAPKTEIKASEGYSILARQRLNRPVAPHLLIYKPQITWYASALNRITGSMLSGAFYVYFPLYLAAPLLGWQVGSASLAAGFAAWPLAAKVAVKFGVALPFTFHSFNGIRHLVWDTGREFSNKQVQVTGWVVVGLTMVGSGLLAAI